MALEGITAGVQEIPMNAAQAAGLELICGIELSTQLHNYSVHLLGYFLEPDGLSDFRDGG